MHCQTHYSNKELPVILDILKLAGLKITKPRESLLSAILSFHRPFSVEEVSLKIIELEGKKNKMDLVTIYRSLSKFAEIGLLSTHDFGDSAVRYELVGKDGGHHHHLICKKCQKVEALKACAIPGQDQVLKKFGYKDVTHKLEFFGICPDCAAS